MPPPGSSSGRSTRSSRAAAPIAASPIGRAATSGGCSWPPTSISTPSMRRPACRCRASATRGASTCARDLGRDPAAQSIRLTTPGIVYKDLLIIGGRAGEGAGSSPGDIRALDVRTGALKWSFHTIPHPGEEGYTTWSENSWRVNGGANNWAGMALDEARGLVFVPTGSAAPDFHGADRIGDNLFANCLLALDAATGKKVWHFQAVHHDIWDRDFPSPPTLVTIRREGRAHRRGGADDQARLRLRPRSRDRRAALPGGREAVCGEYRPGRAGLAHPAGAASSRAVRPTDPDRRPADAAHARGPRLGRGRARQDAQRRAVHASSDRQGHGRVPGFRRRRGMGRQRLRPGLGAAVRQRQRPGLDRGARARRRRHRRPERLLEVMRQLSPRRSPRHAAADPGAHQPHRLGRPADHGDSPGRRPHARLPEPLAGGRAGPGRISA